MLEWLTGRLPVSTVQDVLLCGLLHLCRLLNACGLLHLYVHGLLHECGLLQVCCLLHLYGRPHRVDYLDGGQNDRNQKGTGLPRLWPK